MMELLEGDIGSVFVFSVCVCVFFVVVVGLRFWAIKGNIVYLPQDHRPLCEMAIPLGCRLAV